MKKSASNRDKRQNLHFAAILVIDIIRFSTQPNELKASVLKNMEQVFAEAVKTLSLTGVGFNFTGDGYFCSFTGASGERVLDFVNHAIPKLKTRLEEQGQKFRAGLDFGLIRLKKNALTGSNETVGMPGILATRLEECAPENTLLCSKTIHDIFANHYAEMFSPDVHQINSKDREILAYQVIPLEAGDLQRAFLQIIDPKSLYDHDIHKEIKTILIVDDEDWLREMVSLAIRNKFPFFNIIEAEDGEKGIQVFEKNGADLIIADVNMERLDGYSMLRAILDKKSDQLVIIVTGLADVPGRQYSFSIGAFNFLPKPFQIDDLYDFTINALCQQNSFHGRKRVLTLFDDPGAAMDVIQNIGVLYRAICQRTRGSNDIANTMLRHKAKQLVRDFSGRFQTSSDISAELAAVQVQLESVSRLSACFSHQVSDGDLQAFLNNLHTDLAALHDKVGFKFNWNCATTAPGKMSCQTVFILIVTELIDNALSAMEFSGAIETTVTILQNSKKARIVVKDTGPGIPTRIKRNIFREGVSTKGEGRGLGLWLIREATRSLGGEITYKYEDGAVFCVTLPLL